MFTGSTADEILKELVWSSGVKTLTVACNDDSVPTVSPRSSKTTVNHATAELIVEVAPISTLCPVHSIEVIGIDSSSGLTKLDTVALVSGNNYKITVDLSTRGWYKYKIKTTSGSPDGSNLVTKDTDDTYTFEVWCDPKGGSILDGFTSPNVTLKVGDPYPYTEFSDFTSSNADCGAVHDSYKLVDSTTLGTMSGLTLYDLTGR